MSVFHLKYRPQKIAELDLASVRETLSKILNSGNIPQSFLFVGPKGAGKTSAARILARAVNCTNLDNGDPCGECDNCREILKGSCLDVIEMDAASNRGIDEARDLKEKAYLLPSKLAKKVFIIDEVHMMTRDAFNALLKLIEEPPAHTIFILCTTDEGKIPDTVLSRLMKVNFHKGSDEELKKSLRRVVEGEKMEIEEEAIEMMVKVSDGSFRNLQRTFNEICLQSGEKISKEFVEAYFAKSLGGYTPEEMEKDLVAGETSVVLTKLEKMAETGTDFKAYRESLLVYFQDKLLGNLGVEGRGKSLLGAVELEKWLQLLIVAGRQEKDISLEQLPLELAVAEFLNNKSQNTSSKQVPEIKSQITEEKVEVKNEARSNVDLGIEVEKIMGDWGKVLMAVKPFNHSVEAFLRAARPKSISGNVVTLEVYYPFHKDKLEEQKNRKIVETGLSQVLGTDIVLECVLGKSKQAPLVIKNDTPEETTGEKPAATTGDIYDVAKEIFG